MTGRRKFLKKTLLSAAGVAWIPEAFSGILHKKQNDKLGVALVGLGYYSTDLLAPALQLTQHCRLAGIVTGTPAKAERWKQLYKIPDKNIYNYQNFSSISSNTDIDVVYVVLPPSLHAEYCIKAAGAGKHVWCEKPMAMTVTECQSIIDACLNNKVNLSIGYRMQHEPNTLQIIKFRKELTYGKVLSVEASAGYFDGRTDHWKQKKKMGGGSMYDMGVYPLNAARYVTGLEPVAVSAVRSTNRPDVYTEVDETMAFELDFGGGATAQCESSFGKGMNNLQVKCQQGWYKLAPFQAYAGIKGTTSSGYALDQSIPNQQAKQMDDDARSILNGSPMTVPGEEGLKDIKVVEAVYRSVQEKRKVSIV